MSSKNNDFYLYEYEDVPRGRVIFDIENTQYIVYANNDIITSNEARALVIDEFSLKNSDVVFKNDEHYRLF